MHHMHRSPAGLVQHRAPALWPALAGSAHRHCSTTNSSSASSSTARPAVACCALNGSAPGALAPGSAASTATSSSELSSAVEALVIKDNRATPWLSQRHPSRSRARLLFVGESNVCRSVLALALMRSMLKEAGLEDQVEPNSSCCR